MLLSAQAKAEANDVKDIRNLVEYAVDCISVQEALDVACSGTTVGDRLFEVKRFDGSVMIKKPDEAGYTVIGKKYLF
jgi:hypothetical protein